MSESSSCRTARLGLEARAMEPSGLPLIQCPMCKKEQVLEFVSRTQRNYMERFFKCPKKYIQSPVCSYYIWGDDYARYLEKKGFIRAEEAMQYLQKQQMLRLEVETDRLKQEAESIRMEVGGTDQLKEEFHMLKMQFVEHRRVVEDSIKIAARWGKIFVGFSAVIAIFVVMHIFLGAVTEPM